MKSRVDEILDASHQDSSVLLESETDLAFPIPDALKKPAWEDTYLPGSDLFVHGKPCEAVFALDHGIAKLLRTRPDGRVVILGLRFSGWLLGANAAILEEPYEASAVTLTTSRIRRIPADRFRSALRASPRFSSEVHRMQSREVQDQTALHAGFGALSAKQRLVQFLSALTPHVEASDLPEGRRVRLPLMNRELAQLIRVSPPYLSQLLEELEREDVIRRDRLPFVIVKNLPSET